MEFARRHATGLTLGMTVAVALALSFAPLPDGLRPFPGLREGNTDALVAAVLPDRAARKVASPLPEAATPDAVAVAEVELATDETEQAADAELPAELPTTSLDRAELIALRMLGPAALDEALSLEALGRKLGTKHLELEQGCRVKNDDGSCREWALAPWFAQLDALSSGARRKPVRVIHLGDSLIASDHITDLIRDRLQERFGSAGRGFLFVDRPTKDAGRAVRVGRATPGWMVDKITDRGGSARPVGFTGVAFTAPGESQHVEYDVRGARYAELFFLAQPKGGEVQVRADGQPVGRIHTRFNDMEPAYARTQVPSGALKMSLTSRGNVQLYGVAFEDARPGIVYDSIGLPGATAKVMLRADEVLFRNQLHRRDPALVILMLGGNEAFEYSRKETKPEEAKASFEALLARVQKASPKAACLLISPMDAGVRTMSGAIVPRAGTAQMAEVVREVALEHGCAYWDMFTAMGGAGAAKKWSDRNLMLEDLVHPRARGADLLGHLFDVALARAHFAAGGQAVVMDPPGLSQPRTLAPLFTQLRALERGETDRVAIVQLGASHTASHYFTDVVRGQLAAKFGDAGRGWISAGRASPRLVPSGVTRTLDGPWEIPDATKPSDSAAWGLSGARAEGQAGAVAQFQFCAGCEGDDASRLQLFFLARPGMGKLEILLDGEPVTSFPHELAPVVTERAEVLELRAPGPKHTLTVRNLGPGPVTLFGATHERGQRGVVLDAAGLPSSTLFTLSEYDPAVLEAQLRARRPGAYFLFYGTNESAVAELDAPEMRARYRRVFATLRKAAPEAACLLIGPTDRQVEVDGQWIAAPAQERVITALREVAREHGCAFWSARAQMGGPGSIARWLERQPPLAHPDRIHLTPEGYGQLARVFAEDLLGAYQEAGKAAPVVKAEASTAEDAAPARDASPDEVAATNAVAPPAARLPAPSATLTPTRSEAR